MKRDNIEDIYPLSPVQQGMLFHTVYEPASSIYVEQFVCTLFGALDTARLRLAWQRVLDRHAALRTVFVWEGVKQPLQIVRREATLPWQEYDWRDMPAAEQLRRLEAVMQQDRSQPFVLPHAPLMRLTVIRMAEHDYQLIWSFHHLVLDGWCLPLIMRELLACYDALCHSREPHLPPIQPYRTYIGWLQQQDMERARRFWQQALEGFQPHPLLVGDQPSVDAPASQPTLATEQLQVSPEVLSRLESFVTTYQVTLNTLIQGAWALLLSRYSGEADSVFGMVVSGRPPALPGVETMIGVFINTLPFRVRIPAAALCLPWLKQIQHRQVEIRQYEYTPLVDIQRWHGIPAGQSLFESIIAFENYPAAAELWPSSSTIRIDHLRFDEQTNYPLALIVTPGGALSLRLVYDRRRFDAALVARMLDQLQTILRGIATQPHQRLAQIPYLSDAERHQMLIAWNAQRVDYDRRCCLHHLFEAQALRTPDAVAVICGDERLTYDVLNARANQLAWYLRQRGIAPDMRVGICMERSSSMVVGLLGILKAGAAYVPLDPAYPQERLRLMLDDAQVEAVITEQPLVERLSATAVFVLCLDTSQEIVSAYPRTNPAAAIDAAHLAYVIYTSGSTGRPKGVAITHRSAVALMAWAKTVFSPHELAGVLAGTSICFDLSVFELFVPLSCGGTAIIAETPLHVPETSAAITLLNTVPSAIAELVRTERLPASVRTVNLAGEPLHSTLVRQLYAIPTIERVYNLYGPTEDTTYSTGTLLPRDAAREPSIGYPIANTQAHVLAADMQPVPIGVPGDLYLGGDGLARGYLNQPALTAEKFVPDPFSQTGDPQGGARLYRTGDLARYRADGSIEFLGRADQQVKLRGYRIELGEIEAALRQHPAVQDGVVAIRQDERGDRLLVAYIVARGEQRITGGELQSFLRARLPIYMLPNHVMQLDQLPLTPNGKVDRRALPPLEGSPRSQERPALAPFTMLEETIATIWAGVLSVAPISAEASFFELGGHSLLATQVIARVRDLFKIDLPVRTLFEFPSLRAFTQRVEAAQQAKSGHLPPALVPLPRDGDLPLSYAQQRLWFLDQLFPGNPMYNVPFAVRLSGPLQIDALRQSLNALIQRHESLRTTFTAVHGRPHQVIAPVLDLEVPLIDLRDLPAAQHESEVARRATHEARQPFDLQRGPLLRYTVLQPGDSAYVLLLTFHHIIIDGWSLSVFTRELSTLYNYFLDHDRDHAPLPLAPLLIQYADFAIWQRDWLRDAVLESHLAFWKQTLAGLPLDDLPGDRPRPSAPTFAGARQPFEISAELSAALTRLGQQSQATLFMTLTAAWLCVLHQHTRSSDLTICTDTANRLQAQTEDLIGFFVNQLVLRVNLVGDPTFRELLQRVRESMLSAYAHQELPFEYLVKEVLPKRDTTFLPLTQVKIVLQTAAMPQLSLAGITAEPLVVDTATTKFDLLLNILPRDGSLSGSLEYSTELFESTTIRRLLNHFQTVITAITARPDSTVSALTTMLDQAVAEERSQARQALSSANLQRLRARRQQGAHQPPAKGYEEV
ncbi:MAG TPA: amino acid adenylation domain-containing protein [Herpetosiphonaceae bacterium]